MHPNPAFRSDDHALHQALVDEIGFGMIFATTPEGPRVAHTALLSTGDGAVQFHLSRGNALTRHLDGVTALAVVNGPDGYVSPRWYADQAQVPTWNYVALEMEGRVRRMDRDGLHGLLETLSARNEARLEGQAWTMDKMPAATLSRMMDSIAGFELEVVAWRPTFKLSQNKPADDRARVADGLAAAGSPALAALMRGIPA
ncbi:FMN-binding negative transcriptional regulator [Novosphingobium cyanobacteriorum]|uniref:FMN-binding negative transcriptional regulator n=1 Tax=Novosphingobium cyanobacteriorum TaxID=3024215 RepID=A0ABT6CLX9_9SPHN|nr:FMN-binding negative transcriptional regulator [Novosphingobium cyanobacteriorum]MDF8334534.1 FMN-binding negative transcriptional regulator [Novosphingobium cyanobacteriorum]